MNIPVSAALLLLALICLALAVRLLATLAALIALQPRAALRHTAASGALVVVGTVIAAVIGVTTSPVDFIPT